MVFVNLRTTVRVSTERLFAQFGKYPKFIFYQKANGRSREHCKPFCAYALLARVFFCFYKAQSCLAETILLANEERNFPEQPFYKTVIKRQVFFTMIVLHKMVKTLKAADRDFSGALFSQNFPYSIKNSLEAFSVKMVKLRCGFHARDFRSLGDAYFLKLSVNTKFFSVEFARHDYRPAPDSHWRFLKTIC